MKESTNNQSPKSSREKILDGIKKGEQAIKEGQICAHVQAKEKLKKWLK